MPGLFVTGTDTDVGKTFVCARLIELLIGAGLNVAAMKPVASGAKNEAGILKNADAQTLINAANITADYNIVNPFVFEPAIAPHLAAASVGIKIDLKIIKESYLTLAALSDVVVVEGAGGWYTPLDMETTMASMAENLALPVVIVVGMRLGCLNHALLTVQAVQRSGLPVAGWIANHVEKDFSFAEENIATLKHFLKEIPFIGSVAYQAATEAASGSVDQLTHHLNKQILINILK